MNIHTYIENKDPLYEQCIAISRQNLGANDTYTVHSNCPFDLNTNADRRITNDHARFEWLYRDDMDCFMDGDTILIKPIDFELEKNKVYFYLYQGSKKIYDQCVILPNGNKSFFKEFVDAHRKGEVKTTAWFPSMIKTKTDFIRPIPNGYFVHLGLSSINKIAKMNCTVATRYYSVKKTPSELRIRVAGREIINTQ